ncbi:MAG: DUF1905 domain-containing protein [Tissierellia bacterium]|nr:DUF1905 domain-containing protein [Tissierellia bacterium]
MKKKYEFDSEIKKVPDIDGAYVIVPFDIREKFGKGRVKVGEGYYNYFVNKVT